MDSSHGGARPSSQLKTLSLLPSSKEICDRPFVSITDHIPTYAKELIAGGAAGGFSKTVVAPLERTKILFQTQNARFRSLGLLQSLNFIYKNEGLLGFYKGNGASVLRIVPYAALHFMAYEQYRRWIIERYPIGTAPGAIVDLVAGSLAGGSAVLCTYPLDLARTTLAYQVKDAKGIYPYKGLKDVFSMVLRESGLKGLYRGIGPTLYGMLPYAGLKFYVYERLKSSLPDDCQSSITVKLACGAIAGIMGQTLTYPLDVVRRQMQVQAVGHCNQSYHSTIEGLVSIARVHGVRQLFAGVSINYIKLVPSVAIGFVTYDGLKHLLRVPPREKHGKKINT